MYLHNPEIQNALVSKRSTLLSSKIIYLPQIFPARLPQIVIPYFFKVIPQYCIAHLYCA